MSNNSLVDYCYESYVRHNRVVDMEEFREDFFRFTHIHKSIKKYVTGEDVDVRKILNNLVISYNVFGSDATAILVGQIPEECRPQLKSFLMFLHRMPNIVLLEDWQGNWVNLGFIEHDTKLFGTLNEI